MRRKLYIVFIPAAIVTLILSLYFFTQTSAVPKQPTQQWPAFTMVYTQWGYGYGLNGQPGTQRIKLTYDDIYHWRTEVLSHSAVPDAAGAWSSYNGAEIRGYDPRFGQETVNNVALDAGIYLPDEWLRPDYILNLLRKPNITKREGQSRGEKELVSTEYLPCQEPLEQEKQAGLGPCKSDKREAKRHIRYREQDYLPLEIIDTLDGVVVQKITIEELTIRQASAPQQAPAPQSPAQQQPSVPQPTEVVP